MRCRKLVLGFALAVIPVAALEAQTAPTVGTLLKEGDTVLGMGGVTLIDSISINDSKMWVSLVDTTWPELDRDLAVLRSGFLTLRENTNVLSPAGATLFSWTTIQMNNPGDLAMLIKIRPSSGATLDGVYWNLKQLALKGQPIGPVLPGMTWENLSPGIVRITDGNLVYIMGEARNGTAKLDTLIGYQLDSTGNVLSQTLEVLEGTEIPVFGFVNALPRSIPTGFAANKHGDYICFVDAVGAGSSILLNAETILAREGDPSPEPAARPWQSLAQARVAINDRGDTFFSGSLGDRNTPNPYLLVRNGVKFAQAGDVLPSLSNSPLATGGPAPLFIGNNGDAYWRAETQAGEHALMRNHLAVVVQGRTIVDGRLVTKLEQNEDTFSVSPNGRYMAGRVELQGIGAVVFTDFGLSLEIPGCHGNPGQLRKIAGEPRLGQSLTLGLDNGPAPGAGTRIVFSLRERIPGSDCGVLGPFGEVLTSAAHRIAVDTFGPWNGTGPVTKTYAIPNDLSLFDLTTFVQGYFRVPATRNVRMTNALRIELGAP